MKKLSLIGMALTAAGAIITIVQGFVAEKQQEEMINEKIEEALANKEEK